MLEEEDYEDNDDDADADDSDDVDYYVVVTALVGDVTDDLAASVAMLPPVLLPLTLLPMPLLILLLPLTPLPLVLPLPLLVFLLLLLLMIMMQHCVYFCFVFVWPSACVRVCVGELKKIQSPAGLAVAVVFSLSLTASYIDIEREKER